MARKTKTAAKSRPAKKTTRPAGKKATPAKSKANRTSKTAGKTQFYFGGSNFDPLVTNGKSRGGGEGVAFDTFQAARDSAIDRLIEIIDRCEARLWQLKRARSFEEYQQLTAGLIA